MVEIVKTLEPGLLTALVELEKEAFGVGGMNEWHLVPLIRHGKVFIIKDSGIVAGAAQYMLNWDNPRQAYLVGVSVTAKIRGKGLGTRLLAESIQQLFANNIAEIELTVEANNAAATRIYEEKLGFTVHGFRPNEYGEGQDRLVMKLTSDQFATKKNRLFA